MFFWQISNRESGRKISPKGMAKTSDFLGKGIINCFQYVHLLKTVLSGGWKLWGRKVLEKMQRDWMRWRKMRGAEGQGVKAPGFGGQREPPSCCWKHELHCQGQQSHLPMTALAMHTTDRRSWGRSGLSMSVAVYVLTGSTDMHFCSSACKCLPWSFITPRTPPHHPIP